VRRQLLEFKLAGVDKDDATRDRLKYFSTSLRICRRPMIEHFRRSTQHYREFGSGLEGMPKDFIDAHKPGTDGKIKLTTNYPDAFPIFTFAKSDAVRRKLFIEFDNRAYPKNVKC